MRLDRVCLECGRPLQIKPRGRYPSYCSPACRQRAHRWRARAIVKRDNARDELRDVELAPTPAMVAGESVVDQCAWCGSLVCHDVERDLGDCPAWPEWWRQDPAKRPGHAAGPFYLQRTS